MLDEPLLAPVLQHLKYGVLVDTGTLYGYAVLLTKNTYLCTVKMYNF
jgi:hypothetical protein